MEEKRPAGHESKQEDQNSDQQMGQSGHKRISTSARSIVAGRAAKQPAS